MLRRCGYDILRYTLIRYHLLRVYFREQIRAQIFFSALKERNEEKVEKGGAKTEQAECLFFITQKRSLTFVSL